MCDRPGLLIQRGYFFSPHLFLKVAAECTIRPIWSTCEGYKSPSQAQLSLCARSATPPLLGLWCFFSCYCALLLSVLWLYCFLCCSKHLTVVPRPSPHLPLPWAGCWQVHVCVFIHIRAYLQAYPASFTMHISSRYYRMRMCWRTSTVVGAGRDSQKEWYRTRAHQWIVKDRLTQPKYNSHVLENITMPFKASGFMLWTSTQQSETRKYKNK